jgi:hypothetical protein
MLMNKVAAVAAFVGGLAIAAAAPAAADFTEIDCGSSAFAFVESGYHVDCERSKENVRADESTGSSEIDVMNISSDDRTVFITIVSVRVTAARLYMEHRSLGENFRSAFSHLEIEDWSTIGNRNGYDSAEFNTQISGLPSSCVAVQRYTNAAWTGYTRRLIGMGCSSVDRGQVYTALTKLRAPGD